MSPAELHSLDHAHYWHSFTQMAEYESTIIARGDGVWIEDLEGRRYIDAASSLWCNLHGHRHPKIDAAIRANSTASPTAPRSAWAPMSRSRPLAA